MRKGHKLWWILVALVALWLLWMTLRPNATVSGDLAVLTEPAAERGISKFWLIDIAGNVVVFAPLGFAVVMALAEPSPRKRWLWGTGAGLALSVTIELLQGLTSSRVSSLGDIALNTVGAGVGALVAVIIKHYPKRKT